MTLSPDDFGKFLKSYSGNDHEQLKDVHRYAKVRLVVSSQYINNMLSVIPQIGRFLMRSQLDCIHSSVPGTGVFDIKTRAISPIRHDVHNYTVRTYLLSTELSH